ncbi:MAG: hypothetical protein JOY85_09800 [Acidobacteriaceae bacterium]|nr:hypothetical protein [Acidobacteriaceae bacterium]
MLPTIRLGFVVVPRSLHPAVLRAKEVADWHTPLPLQVALAQFIDQGDFARHVRKMREVYRTRREIILETLARQFRDYLEIVPSLAGLHVTALARTAPTEEIRAVVQKASEAGVEVQNLSTFTMTPSERTGLVLGYGAIPTVHIQEGLRRLLHCFCSTRHGSIP